MNIYDYQPQILGWIGNWKYLLSPLTAVAWEGTTFSTTAKTLIDLSAVFGVPAGVKAVYVTVEIVDSGSGGSDDYLVLSPNNTAGLGINFTCPPVNNRWFRGARVIPCDANGDMYYQIAASGAGTMTIYLRIWGFCL